jgi:ABC-type enterochelin transport system substrate-binding protein
MNDEIELIVENERLKRENAYLRSQLMTPPPRYWYFAGGVMRQNGSGIQKQIPRIDNAERRAGVTANRYGFPEH